MNMLEKFNPSGSPQRLSLFGPLRAWLAKWFTRPRTGKDERWHDSDGAHRGL